MLLRKKLITSMRFCVVTFLILVLSGHPAWAQLQGEALLATLQDNAKLNNAKEVLADFYAGETETGIIVTLRPSAAAVALAARSRSAVQLPEEFRRAGAPVFFNLRDEAVKKELMATVSATVDRIVGELNIPGLQVKRKFILQFGFAARVTPTALEQILQHPEVIEVSRDVVLQAHLAQGIPLINATSARSAYTGTGVSIAICDTGIDTSHPRLGGGGFPNAKVIGGYDTGDDDTDPRPDTTNGNAHGTACAGIAAGNTGTVGDYIGGVAPGAKLYALKISNGNTGSADASAMVAAWEWAVVHQNDDPKNPIKIISTSFGGGSYSDSATCDNAYSSMTTAAANAVAAGITLFVSSGNDGFCGAMGWPACISYVNSVGAVYDGNLGNIGFCVDASSCTGVVNSAYCSPPSKIAWEGTTSADKVTVYSNSASFLTMFAPSHNAYTTDITGSGGYTSGDYTITFGGTSAACPYAAGAAAVLQSAAKAKTGSHLTPAQVRYYLTTYGDNITDSKVSVTKPRVNLGKAVNAIGGGTPPPTPTSFPWTMFLPGLTGKPDPNTYWSALSYVYCSTSNATFSLTSGGVTRSSTCQAGGCAGGSGTFAGWVTTTPGRKFFSWRLTTATCGSWSGSYYYTLDAGKNYQFFMNLDASGQPAVYVAPGSGRPFSAASGPAAPGGAETVVSTGGAARMLSPDVSAGSLSSSK